VPPDVQVKLLRVLQEREFERVGGNTTVPIDVRVIAATNRDLARAITEQKFREDLFYRLNVFPIRLPPLRERLGDVPLLVRFFLEKCAVRVGKSIQDVSPELLLRMNAYRWPGNVRELENIVERAVILAGGETLDVDSTPLPEEFRRAENPVAAPESLETVEREHVRAALERAGWVIEGASGAAKLLALHPNTLRGRMKKLGIVRPPRVQGGRE
jgi:transcriptional regulator with GAF, ATPase, and Fis domain